MEDGPLSTLELAVRLHEVEANEVTDAQSRGARRLLFEAADLELSGQPKIVPLCTLGCAAFVLWVVRYRVIANPNRLIIIFSAINLQTPIRCKYDLMGRQLSTHIEGLH
jgi:hypothetical protein